MEALLEEVVARAFPRGVLKVEPLEGGLTNRNHHVWTDRGHFVLRRWRDDTGLLAIDREAEHANSLRAARAGVGAEVVAFLPECNAMVLAFVPGRTLCAEDLRRGDLLGRVADACRRLHAAERFDGDFDMFELQARYRDVVRKHGFRLPEGYDDLAPQLAAAREALAVRAGPAVPCNNDLLAENFIACGPRLILIDYEYGGNGDACFELGNICSESDLSRSQLEVLVTAYFGEHLRHQVARTRLWRAVAQHGWALWGAIQDGSSPLEFDFWAWGMERHERAVRALTDPGFEALLVEARRTD